MLSICRPKPDVNMIFMFNNSVLIYNYVISCCKYTICENFVKQNFQLFFITRDKPLCVNMKKMLNLLK